MVILETVRIVSSPEVLGGKPRIEGRRISVEHVVKYYLRGGMSLEEMKAAFDLSPAEIYAALSYYYLHEQEIDQALQQSQQLHEQGRQEQDRKLYLLDHGITTQQASQKLGIGERAVRNLIEAGTVQAMKIGGQWYLDPRDLDDDKINSRPRPGRPSK